MLTISARWAIRFEFAIGALMFGFWAVRIAEFKAVAGLSHQALSLFLFISPITLQFTMLLVPRLTRFFGIRSMIIWGLSTLAIAITVLSLIPPKAIIALCFVGIGIGAAFLEIGLNAVAQKLDREGKPLMLSAHGFWSVGFAFGLIFGGWLADMGISFRTQELLVAPILIGLCWYLLRFLPEPKPSAKEQKSYLLNWTILPYCLVPFAALFMEGAMADWGAVFLSEEHAIRPLGVGIITGLFMGGMAITRLIGDWLRQFYSNISLLIASNIALLTGTGLFALASSPIAVALGALLAGLGAGIVYPIVLVIANEGRNEDEAAGIIAAIASVSFVSFLIAPPFMGFVAEHASLQLAFTLLIPFILLTFVWIALIRRRS